MEHGLTYNQGLAEKERGRERMRLMRCIGKWAFEHWLALVAFGLAAFFQKD